MSQHSHEADPLTHAAPSIFDVRSYEAGQHFDWNGDVPQEVRNELIQCAIATKASLDYLCAIYRKGRTDSAAPDLYEALKETNRFCDAVLRLIAADEDTRARFVALLIAEGYRDGFGDRVNAALAKAEGRQVEAQKESSSSGVILNGE